MRRRTKAATFVIVHKPFSLSAINQGQSPPSKPAVKARARDRRRGWPTSSTSKPTPCPKKRTSRKPCDAKGQTILKKQGRASKTDALINKLLLLPRQGRHQWKNPPPVTVVYRKQRPSMVRQGYRRELLTRLGSQQRPPKLPRIPELLSKLFIDNSYCDETNKTACKSRATRLFRHRKTLIAICQILKYYVDLLL